MSRRTRHLKLIKDQVADSAQYSLCYGMRLDKGQAPEQQHPHVSLTLPDGSTGTMALHVINGTPEQVKAQLLESVEAFFEIYADPDDRHTD